MVTKASGPSESAEQKAARERAEEQAREAQIGEIRRGVTQETSSLLSRFGLVTGTGKAKSTAAQQAFAGFGGLTPKSGSFTPRPGGGGGSTAGFSRFAR